MIAYQDTIAGGEGFNNHRMRTANNCGNNKNVRIHAELPVALAEQITGEDYIVTCVFFEITYVFISIRSVSDNYQLLVSFYLPESFNKHMGAVLGNKTADKQHIYPRPEAELGKPFAPRHALQFRTIGNISAFCLKLMLIV